MKKLKIDYRHFILSFIILCTIIVSFVYFTNAYGRVVESIRDFGLSCAYYFCEMFSIEHNITPTINNLPKYPLFSWFSKYAVVPDLTKINIPETWELFKTNWSIYWQKIIQKENVINYLKYALKITLFISQILLIIMPFVLIFYFAFLNILKKANNNYNVNSKPLILARKLYNKFFKPIINWFNAFVHFLRKHNYYVKSFVFIWLFNFNIFAIIIEFLAFYLYFVISFDVSNLYIQFYKLILDVSICLQTVPLILWIIIGVYLFDRFRKKLALMFLRHNEMKNRGLINARPILFMFCGTMGKKKTTALTDVALSQEVMFRDKAFEKILENDLKFPNFPWINLENSLKEVIKTHNVYNLATVRAWVYSCYETWGVNKRSEYIFDYDLDKYSFYYDDKLKVVNIWDVIEIYAQLYFIYIIQSSLIISNYSVRTDCLLNDVGNFPLWNNDFFEKDSRLIDSFSRHAHILDQDTLRLGKKVLQDNENADNFEFGVILITEVGKERGNTLELADKKKNDNVTNQKNDLFNSTLKMIRHSATVDNFSFVRVICDEQRPESWGADARDLTEIVTIIDSGESKLAMPFFALGELLHDWLFPKFQNLYYQYRFVRGDNTLSMTILKKLTAKLENYYVSIYNRFGYSKLRVQIECGTQDGAFIENNYYLANKKVYSKRFSTDCFSDFFAEKSLRSPYGIDDLAEYETEKATMEELSLQNSYFVNDLINGFNKEKNKN